ncbi:MAG: NADH-quinone oxidoreductase subunit N [Dehalococcoidia bacterium]|nr:NADH-quinone oxidoreductase subunit N [Dehalococcoidia bacterium]
MNWWLFLPEFLVVILAFAVFGLDLVTPDNRKNLLAWGGAIGLFIIIGAVVGLWGTNTILYDGLFYLDSFALIFKAFFLLVAVVIILSSLDHASRFLSHLGEYYGLIILATLGMMLMASAGEMITAFVAIELVSFSFYVLASYNKNSARSSEAGIKYIIIGAFSSALMLYGMSLIYAATKTTTFAGIFASLSTSGQMDFGWILGVLLILAGLGFKVSAAPFHMWAPDVYEGAPTPVTAFLSVASKAAGFVLLVRLFAMAFMPSIEVWRSMIVIMSVATMTIGNLVAMRQTNIKRLLAYSSIAQAGYILVGVASLSPSSPMAGNAIILHILGYGVSNLAAFVCIIVYQNLSDKENIEDYAGLSRRAPFVAMAMLVALFSLAGMPFFVGFISKFYLFTAAANQGMIWLALVAIFNSFISLYYYLQVVKQMYVRSPEDPGRLAVPALINVLLVVLVVLVSAVGIYPEPLLRFISAASQILLA